MHRGVPAYDRSESDVTVVTARGGVQTLFIELGSPWEHGDVESLTGELGNELLIGNACCTMGGACVALTATLQSDSSPTESCLLCPINNPLV